MFSADDFFDYELMDASCGERLERFGDYVLVRPDPKVLWKTERRHPRWQSPDARYLRSKSGGGSWAYKNVPEEWILSFEDLRFAVHPMNFKHLGIFPEQAANWSYVRERIRTAPKPVKVLNLFAYTGAATVAAASAGAEVVHVDAARGMVERAKRNLALSGLSAAPVRFLSDDCEKFVRRELRRENRYDAILLDPPSFGRGPNGETWKLEDALYDFLLLVFSLLSDNPLFVLVNTYSDSVPVGALDTLTKLVSAPYGGRVCTDELALPITASGLFLPCGNCARWEGAKL